MPTESHKGILDRDFAAAASWPNCEAAGGLLREVVNYSTHVLARCDQSSTGAKDEDVAVLSIFRSAIALSDGIENLFVHGCLEPVAPLLRSLFEHLLNTEYILEEPSKYRQRSLAWTGFRLVEHNRYLIQLLPDTDRGKKFASMCERDDIAAKLDFSAEVARIKSEMATNLNVLAQEHFREICEELDRGRTTRSGKTEKYTAWHQLFGGPLSIFDLANSLNRGATYALLYPGWSRQAHGAGCLAFKMVDREATIRELRSISELCQSVLFAVTFMISLIGLMHAKFRPGDEAWRSWYAREISSVLMRFVDNA